MQAEILKYLPYGLREEIDVKNIENAEELRIRAGAATSVISYGSEKTLNFKATRKDVSDIVEMLLKHSIYAYMDELKTGFFTVLGGIRVGVAGRMVCDDGKILRISDFSSLNLRFPGEKKGIAHSLMPFITIRGRAASTLIVSSPQMGKTTLLRDVIREFSDGGSKCSVIDERDELYADGRFDLGKRTDVLRLCPKAKGINMALRTLSPDVIATDEIGDEQDLNAIFNAANSGVKIITTVHGGSVEEVQKRLFFKKLFQSSVVERIVLLGDSLGRGTVERIYDGTLKNVCNAAFLL